MGPAARLTVNPRTGKLLRLIDERQPQHRHSIGNREPRTPNSAFGRVENPWFTYWFMYSFTADAQQAPLPHEARACSGQGAHPCPGQIEVAA